MRARLFGMCLGVVAVVGLVSAQDGAGRPATPPPPGLAALTAGEWQKCLEQIAAVYAAPEPPPDPAAHGRRPLPPVVRSGCETILVAAASAQALGPEAAKEWGAKLYGSDPAIARIYEILVELLAGKYDQLVSLVPAARPLEQPTGRSCRWHELATLLDQAAEGHPDRAQWLATAGGLRLLAFWRGPLRDPDIVAVANAFATLPDPAKAKLVDTILGYQGPSRRYMGGGFQSHLQRPISDGRITDLQLVRLLGAMTGGQASSAMASTIAGKSPEAATLLAHEALKANSDDPEVILRSATSLARSGQRNEAIAVLRAAEPRIGYPDRQRIRRQLFSLLRGQPLPPMRPGPGGMRPMPGPPQSIDQFPDLARELETRTAANLPPDELAMAKADLYGTASLPRDMVAAYAEAYRVTSDPLIRRLAWQGWAAQDPTAAWAEHEAIDRACFAGDSLKPEEKGELACHFVRTGFLAKDEAGAAAWAAQRLPELRSTEAGDRAAAFLVLLRLLQSADDLPAAVTAVQPDLATLKDNNSYWLLQAFLADPRRGITLQGHGVEDRQLTEVMRPLLARQDRWDFAVLLGTALFSFQESKRSVGSLWRDILLAWPTDEAQAEARQQALAVLTEKCVAGLTDEPQRTRSSAARDCLQAAAHLVGQPQGKRFLPYCQTVFKTILAEAPALGLDSGYFLVPVIRDYGKGLAKCEGDVPAYCALVRQTFPTDSEVARTLKELEGGQ